MPTPRSRTDPAAPKSPPRRRGAAKDTSVQPGKAAGGRTAADTAARHHEAGTPAPAANAVMPLEVQLATMRALWAHAVEDGRITDLDLAKQACALAKDIAAFIHPRLASVDHSGDMTMRHEDWLDSLPQ